MYSRNQHQLKLVGTTLDENLKRESEIFRYCNKGFLSWFDGQKGTIGITYAQKDMPFTESGIIPDLILNPHGYPSRMSLGHFIECLASKEAAETGHFVDGTPFNNYDVKQLPEALRKLGYSPYGTEKMYCGFTGRQMDVEIFIGPVYNIRLKHMVLDKVHGRARGPRQGLTRQPLEGRSRDGGLKIGKPFCLKVLWQHKASPRCGGRHSLIAGNSRQAC
jgi:hypothetical protein